MIEGVFSVANTAALASWVCLIGLPRSALLLGAIRWGVIGGLSILYACLVSVWFFQVEGGGYFSLAGVQTLFMSEHVALAGWIHYLAFDLFVGLWIAARADAMELSRLIQAGILLTTFMFGPFGLLFFYAVDAGNASLCPRRALPA